MTDTRYNDSLKWLYKHYDDRPFIAKANVNAIRPEDYPHDADTASAVLEDQRVWLFRTREARDVFLKTVKGSSVVDILPKLDTP